VEAGVRPGEVWTLTPAEVDAAVQAESARLEHQRRLGLTQAWVNAALQRQKRLPRLEKFLRRPGSLAGKKSQDEMKQEWAALQDRFSRPKAKRRP
jgi:hypothetical protein